MLLHHPIPFKVFHEKLSPPAADVEMRVRQGCAIVQEDRRLTGAFVAGPGSVLSPRRRRVERDSIQTQKGELQHGTAE